MSLLLLFTATATNTSFSLRVEKSTQHLDIQRTSGVSVTYQGLFAGLPEIISAEITHPVRSRVRFSNDAPNSHVAYWAQHGRGPIAESMAVGGLVDTRFKFYLNDEGPVEVMADDHFMVKFENCIPGATYRVYGPEQQMVQSEANRLFNYETAVILASDRQRTLNTVGKQGIIIPNRSDLIERVVLRSTVGKEQELDLFEIQAVQADTNPFVSVLNITGPAGDNDRKTVFSHSQSADLLLLMFHDVASVQIDTPLGQELKYTLMSVMDRN